MPVRAARADDVRDAAREYAAKRYMRAAALYRRALEHGDKRPEVLYNLGTSLLAADSLASAIDVLERAVEGHRSRGDASARCSTSVSHTSNADSRRKAIRQRHRSMRHSRHTSVRCSCDRATATRSGTTSSRSERNSSRAAAAEEVAAVVAGRQPEPAQPSASAAVRQAKRRPRESTGGAAAEQRRARGAERAGAKAAAESSATTTGRKGLVMLVARRASRFRSSSPLPHRRPSRSGSRRR